MHPILLKIGTFELFSYGLMMAIGVLVSLVVMDSEAKRLGWNRDQTTRLVVFTFLAGLLGARLVYVLTRINDPSVNLTSLLFNARAGFVYYGGLIGAWVFLVWYLRRTKLPFWQVSDGAAMGICIGLAIGRIGCFLGGCCFGTPTHLPWGVIMANEPSLGHLHPAQLYEFLVLVLLFGAMWWRRTRRAYEGELVVWFVGVYAVARYVLEFWRGDSIRGFIVDDYLSTSQALSIPMLALAVVLHLKLMKSRQSATVKR